MMNLMPMRRRKRKIASLEVKKSRYGYLFLAPWLIGLLVYFLQPMMMVIRYSFSRILLTETGYELEFRRLENFRTALFHDPDYLQRLYGSFTGLIYQVSIILTFSLIIAVVLNRKFRGRTVMRAIFFVPVIVSSGVVISIINGDNIAQMIISGDKNSSMLSIGSITDSLYSLGLPMQLITPLIQTANNIFSLTWKSGIQILIFLGALQTIPPSLYEASSIEGATSWENFWKITFPMISPMTMLVLVYTVIDSFTDYNNGLMQVIIKKAADLQYETSSAMMLVYSICIVVVLGVLFAVFNKRVFYMSDH
jgi:ABC-type sugar transport system permease subunit